jgi:uncharacterized repeat protein (TIGR03803 family)
MGRRSFAWLAVAAALAAAAPARAQDEAMEEPATAAEETAEANASGSKAAALDAIHPFRGGEDGGFPRSGLVVDKEGNLYGAAAGGECADCGIVYMLSPPVDGETTWSYRELHRFEGGSDGAGVAGALTIRGNAVYGATAAGGDPGCDCGTVFRLKPLDRARTRWDYSVLYRLPDRSTGAAPAGVTFGEDTALYGVTSAGGAGEAGTIFKLKGGGDADWRRVVLHHFSEPRDGGSPRGEPVFGPNRTLFGTTAEGGRFGEGTVFRLTRNGSYAVLHHFRGAKGPGSSADGAEPVGALALGQDGALYGTTLRGGEADLGTVFRLTPTEGGRWLYTIVHHFAGGAEDGAGPRSGLAMNAAGELFGVTAGGGAQDGGALYRLTRIAGGWGVDILHAFDAAGAEGGKPHSRPAVKNGALYGTTMAGGSITAGGACSDGCGTVYQLGE